MIFRAIFVVSFLFMYLSEHHLYAQAWIHELEKHEDKPFHEIEQAMEAYFDVVGRENASKYKHYARWAGVTRDHLSEDGHTFNYAVQNRQLLKMMEREMDQLASSGSRHFHGAWTSMNPDNFETPTNNEPAMGRVNCMTKKPSNNNIIYVGAATGGLWKSINNGSTWTPLMDGMVQLGVSSIVIDYTNENHILILTGDADFGHMPSSGVFESYDAGATWSLAYEFPLNEKNYGYKMIQSKANANEYYLALKGTQQGIGLLSMLPSPELNFEYVSAPVFDIEYKPGSTNILHASSTAGLLRKDPLYNWTLMNGISDSTGLPLAGFYGRTQIAVSAADPDVLYNLYLRYEDPTHYWALFKSTDGGFHFEPQVDSSYSINLVGDQGTQDLVLEVDPTNSAIVYIGGQGLYKSVDSGELWTSFSNGLHADMHNMYFQSDALYICTDGGLSKRLPNGSAWTSINNGLLITQFYNIDIDGNRFLGGAQDNGTMYWDNGDEVGLRISGGDGFDCFLDKDDSNMIYISNVEKRERSTNNGDSFTVLHNNKYKGPITNWVNRKDTIISTEEFIHVSFNNGVTWQTKINPFAPDTMRIIGFSQSEFYPNTVYVNSMERVYKTENFNLLANATWANITGNLPTNPNPDLMVLEARDIVVHPVNPDLVYLSRAGYKTTQIYVTYTGGTTWYPWSTGISQLPVYSMTYDSQNGNALYIGTELGVYYRKTSSPAWFPFSNYLPRVPVQEIVVNNTFVYAATFGRGLWRSPGYSACATNITLSQTNDPTAGGPSGFQIHKASNNLFSSRIIQGGAGTDVTYQAANYVSLTDGFYAKGGINVLAKGCLE